jgi:hypothetical protein
MEECLAYFRAAIYDPRSVPPWAEWWATHAELVEQVFPRHDFVRLKHRRLIGVRQILKNRGELPEDFHRRADTGCCGVCGERTIEPKNPGGGWIICPNCGPIMHIYCRQS